jgi:hypothetical protein
MMMTTTPLVAAASVLRGGSFVDGQLETKGSRRLCEGWMVLIFGGKLRRLKAPRIFYHQTPTQKGQ